MDVTRGRLHSCHPIVPCVVCRARAVETLLTSGRPEMALALARGLADDIVEHLGWAMLRGREQAQVAARFAPPALSPA